MDKNLFKSALKKCKQAQVTIENLDRCNSKIAYDKLIRDYSEPKDATKALSQVLKKVTDLVTQEEFAELLKWPAFYRGWSFFQRFMFEEALGLNKDAHNALKERLFRLPSRENGTELQADTLVKETVFPNAFRLVEIWIDEQSSYKTGDFLLEMTEKACFLLHIWNGFQTQQFEIFQFVEFSSQMPQQLEWKTQQVRKAFMQNYFPTHSVSSLDAWFGKLLTEMSASEDGRTPVFVKNRKKISLAKVKRVLRSLCLEKHLASRAEWRALKKVFGIGDVVYLLDRNSAVSQTLEGKNGLVKWSEGEFFRIIWLELPYDIEVPIFRKNGEIYILRTVSDLSKV